MHFSDPIALSRDVLLLFAFVDDDILGQEIFKLPLSPEQLLAGLFVLRDAGLLHLDLRLFLFSELDKGLFDFFINSL